MPVGFFGFSLCTWFIVPIQRGPHQSQTRPMPSVSCTIQHTKFSLPMGHPADSQFGAIHLGFSPPFGATYVTPCLAPDQASAPKSFAAAPTGECLGMEVLDCQLCRQPGSRKVTSITSRNLQSSIPKLLFLWVDKLGMCQSRGTAKMGGFPLVSL